LLEISGNEFEYDALNDIEPTRMIVVIMNKNPESHYFTYSATPDKFDLYFPAAKQMLKTLSLLNMNLEKQEKVINNK